MVDVTPGTEPPAKGLGASARASLLWGGGFTLLRDVAQFFVMLILVRLLTPTDYGTAALVQAIIGFASVLSYSTFSLHALQIRDPADIDWQAHFSFAFVVNITMFSLLLFLSLGLAFAKNYHYLALPLAALSTIFIIEIPATLRHRMLEAMHDWKRYRVLLIIGTILGLGSGLAVALLGGGVWALIVQPPMLGLPAAIDLLVIKRFRPDWSWSWARWQETFHFGLDRLGSGLAGRTRALNENILLSNIYNLATLGIFTRAGGLAMLGAGRIGSIAMGALYPVVTRAKRGSPQFQRLSALLLRGVVWATMPAAAVLALTSHDIVALLYGEQWEGVSLLLPLAAAATSVVGIWGVLSSLLVANDGSRPALWIDLTASLSAIALAFLLIPYGAEAYLAGLALHGLVCSAVTTIVLIRKAAITVTGIGVATLPTLVAVAAGTLAMKSLHGLTGRAELLLPRLTADVVIFACAYLLCLRALFRPQLTELLEVVPGGTWLARWLWLTRSVKSL